MTGGICCTKGKHMLPVRDGYGSLVILNCFERIIYTLLWGRKIFLICLLPEKTEYESSQLAQIFIFLITLLIIISYDPKAKHIYDGRVASFGQGVQFGFRMSE